VEHATIIPERRVSASSGLYIDVDWRAGPDRPIVLDPATGAGVGQVVAASPDQVREAWRPRRPRTRPRRDRCALIPVCGTNAQHSAAGALCGSSGAHLSIASSVG
jgi:hypothetical protein